MSEGELSTSLQAGSYLIDAKSTPQSELKSALISRLRAYYSYICSSSTINDSASLEAVQLRTADEALCVVERVQQVLQVESNAVDTKAPLIGARDLNELRTLLSISLRWGVDPLLSHVISSWPSTSSSTVSGSKIIDLTSTPDDYHRLTDLVSRILALVFPKGVHGNTSNTLITEAIFQRHIPDILKPAISLGWLPKSLSMETMLPLDNARPSVMRLLAILPPAEAILSLGSVMSSTNSVLHVRRTCGYLMSRQLLRPEGVQGLCAAVFGDTANVDDVQLDKLQHIARVLNTTPAGMKPEEYFSIVVPRITNLLQDNDHPAFRRAAAFALSHMLAVDGSPAAEIITSLLHEPFFRVDPGADNSTVPTALTTLITLLTNSDPSPKLIRSLLSPTVSQLYSLLFHLDSIKTSDPELKESVRGLLMTWSRIVSTSEALGVLWSLFDNEPGQWLTDLEGGVRRVAETQRPKKLSLFTPEDLKRADEAGELDPGANILDLYPEPRHLVAFLQSTKRSDVLSEFFVKLLESYRDNKNEGDGNPTRSLLYLQMIMQMQTAMSDNSTSAGLFSKPIQILTFIKQALDTTFVPNAAPARKVGKISVKDIRISNVRSDVQSEDNPESEGDSDDDLSDSEAFTADDEMTETTITLLLSVLEGKEQYYLMSFITDVRTANEALSARTEPILNEIFELLEPHSLNGPSAVRAVAREARMVMTARLALSNGTSRTSKTSQVNDSQEIYQNALKLLQDPILPVRAHGLLLLRQLVSSDSEKLDPALVPAIQEIFLQSIHDDDSYIFLNAVQGLAALVDNFDRGILKRLVQDYTRHLDGLEAGNMTQQDVDTRIRLGESLSLVIRRCGEALGPSGNIIIPPLLRVVRSRTVPTTIRTSSLSLLADCQSASALVLLPYFVDLSEGMIDLLQVETVSSNVPAEVGTEEKAVMMDDHPTSTNTKFPPLRRAALHFLSLLLRGTTHEIGSSLGAAVWSKELLHRMRITLSYIAGVDDDRLVKVMAREALEDLEQLELARLGL